MSHLVVILATLVIIVAFGWVLLALIFRKYANTALYRVKIVDLNEYMATTTKLIGMDRDVRLLAEEARSQITSANQAEYSATPIRKWIMDQSDTFGAEIRSRSPYGRLMEMKEGKGAHCTDMALIYVATLNGLGIPARYVIVARSLFDRRDSHVTVEVLQEGNWKVSDPFFNAEFLVNGSPDSALAVRSVVLENNNSIVSIQEGEPARYPVKASEYYIRPETMFATVKLAAVIDFRLLSRLPIVRYFRGTVYIIPQDRFGIIEVQFLKMLSAVFNLVFPMIGIGLAVAFLITLAMLLYL
jgi:hypothetical protein